MVLAATTGARNALKVFVNFPGMYLISAFSFWMVGPKSERCCSFESDQIGISFCLTWFNVFLTIGKKKHALTQLSWLIQESGSTHFSNPCMNQ